MSIIEKSTKKKSAVKSSPRRRAGQDKAGTQSSSTTPQCLMKTIGTIRTPFPEPKGTPLEPSRAEGARGTVWIDEPYREALLDLEGFDRVWLLFWLHKAPEGTPLVTPFLDVKQHGLFATRAPARFNPIGISAVRLLAVHADHLEVADVDIVDGTPLFDVKPYVPEFDSHPESRSGWFAANKNTNRIADGRFMKAEAPSSQLRLAIEGMKCIKCVERVRNTIQALPGVSVATVEIGSAVVGFDAAKAKPAAILKAVTALGFPARRSAKKLK
jgi:tRNA-Thr(GGU) m(6)t(6)A37 methyltransferase TsaA